MQEFVEIDDCTVKRARKIILENNNFFTFCSIFYFITTLEKYNWSKKWLEERGRVK